MALLEALGVFGQHLLHDDWPTAWSLAAGFAIPWLTTAAVVAWYAPRMAGASSLGSQLPKLMAGAVLAAVASAALQTVAAMLETGKTQDPDTLYRIAQSGFTGTVVVAPLLLAVFEQVRERGRGWSMLLSGGQVLVPAGVLLLTAQFPLAYPLSFALALGFSALSWLALRQGWRATCVALVCCILAVCTSQVLMQGWDAPRMQLLMSASAAAAVLLGAATDAVRVQDNALHMGLAQLNRRGTELADAARRLVSAQEHERRTLGSELHDVVGQDITAIATRLRVVERTTSDPEVRKGLHSISVLVMRIPTCAKSSTTCTRRCWTASAWAAPCAKGPFRSWPAMVAWTTPARSARTCPNCRRKWLRRSTGSARKSPATAFATRPARRCTSRSSWTVAPRVRRWC